MTRFLENNLSATASPAAVPPRRDPVVRDGKCSMLESRFRECCNDMHGGDESLRSMTAIVQAVDERLAPVRPAALGLQHMLVMYAGAIAVPLIVDGAVKLPWEQIAALSA